MNLRRGRGRYFDYANLRTMVRLTRKAASERCDARGTIHREPRNRVKGSDCLSGAASGSRKQLPSVARGSSALICHLSFVICYRCCVAASSSLRSCVVIAAQQRPAHSSAAPIRQWRRRRAGHVTPKDRRRHLSLEEIPQIREPHSHSRSAK
jgi:hypothetical protein